ncbi:MAG: hypothetical protein HGB12_08925 [Bacteroidetes bacterium]|nr:hypothetical protein [Bacteroidota bacterium]
MKNKNIRIIFLAITSLIVIAVVVYVLKVGSIANNCLPGYQKGLRIQLPGDANDICYWPSKYDNKSCNKNSDCGNGACYIRESGDNPTCSDYPKDGKQRWYNQDDINSLPDNIIY